MDHRQQGRLVLAAAAVLAAVLGSVHAFSVFLEPLEARFGAGRAVVSLTYSFALVALTAAVLGGHLIYPRWPPARLMLVSGLLAAGGAALAAVAPSLWLLWVGYSVAFGAANGLGYGFGLQLAAQANPGREGLAMGIVTAAYASGAVWAPAAFAIALDAGGFPAAMTVLIVAILVAATLSAVLLAASGFRYTVASATPTDGIGRAVPIGLTWLAYGCGVAAGLMAIGHAAGIARAGGLQQTWIAPAIIAVCNFTGALAAGRLADRLRPALILTALPLVSAAALVTLASGSGSALLALGLGLAGFAYGGLIAAWPAVIAKRCGPGASARVYGRVFTAWGAAGLLAPWLAGAFYDRSGAYGAALLTAAGLALLSALTARVALARP